MKSKSPKTLSPRFLIIATAAVIMGIPVSTSAQAASHAPLGFQLMCLQSPSQCKPGGKAVLSIDENLMATIKRVNSQVNVSITPRSDGSADVWNANATSGDCEDYALAKRKALINAGISPSALRIAYVKTRSGEGHAILLVKTKRGDFVLDNLSRTVKPLSQTGYRIILESGANPLRWS